MTSLPILRSLSCSRMWSTQIRPSREIPSQLSSASRHCLQKDTLLMRTATSHSILAANSPAKLVKAPRPLAWLASRSTTAHHSTFSQSRLHALQIAHLGTATIDSSNVKNVASSAPPARQASIFVTFATKTLAFDTLTRSLEIVWQSVHQARTRTRRSSFASLASTAAAPASAKTTAFHAQLTLTSLRTNVWVSVPSLQSHLRMRPCRSASSVWSPASRARRQLTTAYLVWLDSTSTRTNVWMSAPVATKLTKRRLVIEPVSLSCPSSRWLVPSSSSL